jgi:hypothetical protein
VIFHGNSGGGGGESAGQPRSHGVDAQPNSSCLWLRPDRL